jgi:uncharacterized membrane protein HdeD (DUF308 family)
LRGILAVIFGIMALAWPGLTVASLVIVFAAFALVEGGFAVAAAIAARKEFDDWWVLLLEGLLAIAFGVLTFEHPGITALVLLLYISAWAILSGILRIALAIKLRKEMQGEWLLILAGVAAVLFGLAVMARPEAGAIALAWLIGAFALIEGFALIAFALQVRRVAGAVRSTIAAAH